MMEVKLGAQYVGNGFSTFRVWAPFAQKVSVHIVAPRDESLDLERDREGYHSGVLEAMPGSWYFYRLDGGNEYPDPASRFQPQGVHGPSEITYAGTFEWEDLEWRGVLLSQYIIYELHVGTFSPQGTLDGAIAFLGRLVDLGVTAVELMPVAQFPGNRNWGYDGVYPFAVQNSYGGPDALKRFVNACHKNGLAVILDVVFNHLGPEGNYLAEFGSYFTGKYQTPWGSALNFDGPESDHVRRFFIEAAMNWLSEFRVDAMRLDALHAIFDSTPRTFLEDLTSAVGELRDQSGRRIYLIGESDANDRRVTLPVQLGGYGLDAQWNEGFHHALHALITGERSGYYRDFGELRHLAKAFREGFVYSGEYSVYRQRRHGTSSRDIPASRFVVFAQNHDQIGNRMHGERIGHIVSFEGLKLTAGAVLLSPFIPLIFMGEEYAEASPFQFFTSYIDQALVEAVRRGRLREFPTRGQEEHPPDPQAESTFVRSKLDQRLCLKDEHLVLHNFYRELIFLRRQIPALVALSKKRMDVGIDEKNKILQVRRWTEGSEVMIVFNFCEAESSLSVGFSDGTWHKQLDSADGRWLGAGSQVPGVISSNMNQTLPLGGRSFILFKRSEGP
jgi:maltooligosyltrehalose trehalohydrolase